MIKTRKHSIIASISGLLFTAPSLAFAQSSGHTLAWLIMVVMDYMNKGLFLLMGVAIVMFVFYVIRYYIMPNEDRKNANLYVMYSIIGFFVILSFWGLVNILQNTFGLQNDNNRPSSWYSFSNLFPTSGGSSRINGGTFNSGDGPVYEYNMNGTLNVLPSR